MLSFLSAFRLFTQKNKKRNIDELKYILVTSLNKTNKTDSEIIKIYF